MDNDKFRVFLGIIVIIVMCVAFETVIAGEYKRSPNVQQYYDDNAIPEIKDEVKRAEQKECDKDRKSYRRLRDRYAYKFKHLRGFFKRWEARCGSLDEPKGTPLQPMIIRPVPERSVE